MKKKVIMFAAVCISMGLLAGCGDTEKTRSSKDTKSTESAVEEVVMYESKNVRITYLGEDESFMGHELELKIENLSNQKLTVQARDVSVNDIMMNTIFSADVTPGKTSKNDLTFMSDFEDNNITKIDTVELSFHIFNSDTFDTVEDTEIVTLKP